MSDPYEFGEAYFDPEVARHYGQKHRSFRRRFAHARECRVIARLLGSAPASETSWVLDAPSGSGRFSPTLHQLGFRVVSADRAATMTAQTLQHGSDRAVTASLSELPFADDAFAAMICIRFLHHLPGADERVACLREMRRVTRGPIVASTWLATPLTRFKRHRRARKSTRYLIDSPQLHADLEAAGLRLVASRHQLRGWSPLFYMRLES